MEKNYRLHQVLHNIFCLILLVLLLVVYLFTTDIEDLNHQIT